MSRRAIFFALIVCSFAIRHAWADLKTAEWRPKPSSPTECRLVEQRTEMKADFDQNGREDVARLQQNAKSKQVRLAAWMNGASEPIVLTVSVVAAKRPREQAGETLRLIPVGEKVSLPGENPQVVKDVPYLVYSGCEAFDAYFTWSKATKKFTETWDEL